MKTTGDKLLDRAIRIYHHNGNYAALTQRIKLYNIEISYDKLARYIDELEAVKLEDNKLA